MADRTSAYLFSTVFKLLAGEQPEVKKTSLELWKDMSEYDFGPSQMGCDSALIKLGFAAKSPDGSIVYADIGGNLDIPEVDDDPDPEPDEFGGLLR